MQLGVGVVELRRRLLRELPPLGAPGLRRLPGHFTAPPGSSGRQLAWYNGARPEGERRGVSDQGNAQRKRIQSAGAARSP